MNDHTEVAVSTIPFCDFCENAGVEINAYADARIGSGGWANVCKVHFDYYCCELGLGSGQRLVLREESNA